MGKASAVLAPFCCEVTLFLKRAWRYLCGRRDDMAPANSVHCRL